MIKPYLWSKSMNSVTIVYWHIKSLQLGIDPNKFTNIFDLIEHLTNVQPTNRNNT
jgi:hypothetical protein